MPIQFSRGRQLRDWRDFAREILIIVVGVLIALGATHVAEQWNWQRRVDDAERQLAIEAAHNFAFAVESVTVGPCIERQLAGLRERIRTSGDTLVPAPVHEDAFADFVLRVPSRPIGTTVWQSLRADGTVPHLEDWRRLGYAEIDNQITTINAMQAETDASVGRLRVLGEPLPLDPSTRARLLETIEEQRYRSTLHALMSVQIMSVIRDLGNAPTDESEVEEMLELSGTVAFCRQQGWPLADWKQALAALPPTGPED